ncbi:MAG TPA: DUF2807 domain-containing protein [Azospirillaceae bacterium]|nr:DUF2807 domain-containing protein [Azospirillaceae bacterium]
MKRTTTILAGAAALLLATSAQAFERQEFDARGVSVEGVIGRVTVAVAPKGSRVSVAVSGKEEPLSRISVRLKDGKVEIEQGSPGYNRTIRKEDWVEVQVTVPEGASLGVADFIGEATVGDLQGDLAVADLTSGTLKVGRVASAAIEINGSGEVTLGDVARGLAVDISGSGDVEAGRTGGDVAISIDGSGDVTVGSVQGPVTAAINGSGDILVKDGTADPLTVSVSGSGNFTLQGTATSQTISQSGSGKVRIGRTG